jgi:hypothetical protein
VATLTQYLKDVAEDEFTIPADEVEALANRFGSKVRGMGYWNADGTLTLSKRWIGEALSGLDKHNLLDAATALDPARTFTDILDRSPASTIIDRLHHQKERRLEELSRRLQETQDEAEAETLSQEVIRLVFPS